MRSNTSVVAPSRATKPIERIPVTQEFLAVSIASGEESSHPGGSCFNEALYDSIRAMVYKLATQYAPTCREDVEDLAQDCMLRLAKVICKYDPARAKFTTWTWRICRSVLDSHYQRNLKRARHIVGQPEDFDAKSQAQDTTDDSVMKMDFSEAVSDLVEANPSEAPLIHELFGNPRDPDFALMSPKKLRTAARTAGVEYMSAYTFYCNVVRPFFKQRFDYHGGRNG